MVALPELLAGAPTWVDRRTTPAVAPVADLEVSIVMPCLDEQETVGICVAKARSWLHRTGVRGEILVVDNGSKDGSVAIAAAAGARVIQERRRGYGSAVRRAFAEARGRIIIMSDSDDTYDLANLSSLIAPIQKGDADIVLGNRFTGGVAPGAMPALHRIIGTPFNNLLLRIFFGVRVGDSHSGLRAFRRDMLEQIHYTEPGFTLTAEMLVRTARAGMRLVEVPAPYGVSRRISKLNTIRDGWAFLRFLLLAAPDFLFILPGLVFALLGAGVFGLSFLSPNGIGIGSNAWQPVFAGPIFLAIGANAVVFGIIAKLHGNSMGLVPEDRWVGLYRRFFKMERLLLAAGILIVAGIGMDGLLFAIWATGGKIGVGIHLAALAQTLLVIGVQLGFASFLLVTLESE